MAPDPITQTSAVSSGGANVSNGRKYLILLIVSWNALVVTFLSTSLLTATPEISEDLHTTPEILNITNAGVLLGMGCSSLIWIPVGQLLSRRHSYNIAILFMFAASIGTAAAPGLRTFIAMRVLSGLTGTYFMVAGQTIIADLFEPVVRGGATGYLQVGSVSGTALGPCIGGVIISFSSWRSIYWLQVAMSGFGLALSLLFIPSIENEVRQLAPEMNISELSGSVVLRAFNPSNIFKQFLRPQVFLADLACGFLAVTQYGLLTSVRHIINPRFHLTTPLVSGLFYIAPGAGFLIGSMAGGYLSDRTVRRYIKKRNGLRLPKDRLNSGLVYLFALLPISMLVYGWCLKIQFGGLVLPIVMAFCIGTGLLGAWNGLNTYNAEVFPAERSEVVCSKYILQYIFGAAATASVLPLMNTIDVGWTFTIFSLLKILGGFLLLVIARLTPDTGVWACKG